MYHVYAAASDRKSRPYVLDTQFADVDGALKHCLNLHGGKYRLLKVVLPSGAEVSGDRVTSAIFIGPTATRVILAS